jgi:glycosyltransferase involved in cell wall biosynthesis
VPPARRVDAVIPTYNAVPERLRAAVASCLAAPQVGRVIVVDDGSRSPADPGSASGQLEVVRQNNAGPSAARNHGLSRARAEFALLLDDDDELEPAMLAEVLAAADRTGAGVVLSARSELHPDGSSRLKTFPVDYGGPLLPSAAEVFRPIAVFGASGILVRRSLIGAGLRFDEDLRIGEDRDFLWRAAAMGPVALCRVAALRVRIHDGGSNLSSPAHLSRRVRDHLVLLDRYHDAQTDAHLREQTRWLLGLLAKQDTPDPEAWESLRGAARRRGWPVPLKARVRVLVRSLRAGA